MPLNIFFYIHRSWLLIRLLGNFTGTTRDATGIINQAGKGMLNSSSSLIKALIPKGSAMAANPH